MRKVAWPTGGNLAHNAALYLGALVLIVLFIGVLGVGLVALVHVATGGG